MKSHTTPGTWVIDPPVKGNIVSYIKADGKIIATIEKPLDGKNNALIIEQAKANAKLWIASKQLLEVLTKLNKGFIHESGIDGNSYRVEKNLDYWNKMTAQVLRKAIL